MRHSLQLLAALVLLTLATVACGSEDDADPIDAPATDAALQTANSDVTSGCWTAANRILTGGTDSVANHQQWSKPPEMQIDGSKKYQAEMETNKGSFTVDLLLAEAPLAANNFVCLARAGYFDGTPFHRILAGFVIQGGDPTGTGTGGPGYRFNDEPISKDYLKGTVAMANSGANTNGSQFFVVLDDLRGKLGKSYTIFGEVSEGMYVVEAIGKTPTQASRGEEKSSPTEPVILEKVTITES